MKLKRSRKNIGAILIEFAFAVPVFLILVYYVHDLPRMKLMQRKMQFVAYESAAILQNIARQKNRITKNDIVEAVSLSYLTIFPGNTLFCSKDRMAPLGYIPFMSVYCVTGKENKVIWDYGCRLALTPLVDDDGELLDMSAALDNPHSSLSLITQVAGKLTYPILPTTESDDKKNILIECTLFYFSSWQFSNGVHNSTVPPRKAFNFLFLSPKRHGIKYDEEQACFFPALAIFSSTAAAFNDLEDF